jgi:hypothetical protein
MPAPVAPLSFSVAPDRDHLVFFGPAVVEAGPRAFATYWHVVDRYGNPAAGAIVTIRSTFGSETRDVLAVVTANATGGTGVWVNFSAPSMEAGAVSILDAAGTVVVGPIEVPAVAPGPPVGETALTFAAAIPIGATGAVLSNFVARRTRRRLAASEADEEELRTFAEGRDRVVEVVRRLHAADLGAIEAVWQPRPAPAALVDWLASLVADGTLSATVGPDGRARFCLAPGPAPSPRITVDPDVFERALRGRDAELEERTED